MSEGCMWTWKLLRLWEDTQRIILRLFFTLFDTLRCPSRQICAQGPRYIDSGFIQDICYNLTEDVLMQ